MAKDVYGYEARPSEGWVLDGVVMQIEEAEDIVITQVSVNYPRNISKFSPLNQSKRIMIAGEGNGAMQLGAVLGPTSALKAFFTRYGDACRVEENSPITLSPGAVRNCSTDETFDKLEFVCSGCLLQTLGFTIQRLSQDTALLQAGMSLMFNSLQIK